MEKRYETSGQGKLMPFVDPDRIEQSDRVQAASFAPMVLHVLYCQHIMKWNMFQNLVASAWYYMYLNINIY